MSRRTKDRLYDLLPSIYRQQDITQQTPDEQRPLQDLLAIMEDVLETLEKDIEGLYENWFVETCSEWVVPYIGDLVGASLLRTVKGSATVSGRAYVANTIQYRKRKGTAAVLEEIARDITGYDARAVEFFQLLSTTQNINHVRPWNKRTFTIRNPDPMELVDTAFDQTAHTLDVRSIKNGQGYYNIPNIGIFLWRLTAYPVKKAQAFHYGGGKYSFSQIGLDMPLFNHPENRVSDLGVAEEINISTPIRRLAMKNNLTSYYGEGKSILVEVDRQEKTPDQIIVCDLSDDAEGNWNMPEEFTSSNPPKGKVAIDPALGRLMLPNAEASEVHVNYYYGFTADMGGGFYQRSLYEAPLDAEEYLIGSEGDYSSLTDAIKKWNLNKQNAIFEFTDSETYTETELDIEIPANKTVVVSSALEQRATLIVADSTVKINVTGQEGSVIVLEGLLLDRSLKVVVNDILVGGGKSNLGALFIQHCSLVPPNLEEANSITVNGNDFVTVTLDRSISGPVYMKDSMGSLVLKDSIVDTGSIEQKGSKNIAVTCMEASIDNTTIFGKSNFEMLNYASNVIFTDTVMVKRRQEGCVRFSYITHRFESGLDASRMPRCYRCQPQNENSKVAPRFTFKKYGSPGYAQLHKRAVKEISEGADNEAEMGAFNQAYQAHRINNLLAAFAEYLPFGLEAGIILVT
jgi:hypothetical protein